MASKTHNSKGSQKAKRTIHPVRQRLYDLKMAATYLGRPVWSIRELIWKGALPVVKDGRKLYVDLYDMDQYVERNKEIMV